MMGLGSLFGEGDLQTLDGDPVKEKQVVDKQVTALWEILWVRSHLQHNKNMKLSIWWRNWGDLTFLFDMFYIFKHPLS